MDVPGCNMTTFWQPKGYPTSDKQYLTSARVRVRARARARDRVRAGLGLGQG